jgi:hypothetical protein
MRRTIIIVCLVFSVFSVYADPLYTITVRGLRQDFPLIAWQMTYKIG